MHAPKSRTTFCGPTHNCQHIVVQQTPVRSGTSGPYPPRRPDDPAYDTF